MTPELDITLPNHVRIVVARINDDVSRTLRRQREQKAVASILEYIFGHETMLDHNPDGSPFLPALASLHISISHSAHYAVVALSHFPVGVDIEEPRRQLFNVAPRVFSDEELQSLGNLDALLNAWTVKEALYKLHPTKSAANFREAISLNPMKVDGLAAKLLYSCRFSNPNAHLSLVGPAVY